MSNRSGSHYAAPTDADRRPTLLAVNSVDGVTPEAVELDTADGGVLVHVTSVDAYGNILVDIQNTLIDKPYDYVGMSNADGNGNYQTVVYKLGGSSGTLQRTITITYDGSSNVTSMTRT